VAAIPCPSPPGMPDGWSLSSAIPVGRLWNPCGRPGVADRRLRSSQRSLRCAGPAFGAAGILENAHPTPARCPLRPGYAGLASMNNRAGGSARRDSAVSLWRSASSERGSARQAERWTGLLRVGQVGAVEADAGLAGGADDVDEGESLGMGGYGLRDGVVVGGDDEGG